MVSFSLSAETVRGVRLSSVEEDSRSCFSDLLDEEVVVCRVLVGSDTRA